MTRPALFVLGLPCLAFVLLAAVAPLRRRGLLAAWVSIAAIAAALVTALAGWAGGARGEARWVWIPAPTAGPWPPSASCWTT